MMKRLIPVLAVTLWSTLATAAPLLFSSATYTTDALAIAGAQVDSNSDVNPGSALPLLTSATANSGNDTASSAGTADTGFLGASAEANSEVDNASGLASAEFVGTFTGLGLPISFALSYDSTSTGNGTAEARLLVTFNTQTLFDELITGQGSFATLLNLATGIDGLLGILLTSSADATNANALNIASAEFSLNVPAARVPVAPTLPLALAGLAILGMVRHSSARRVRHAA